MRFPGQLPEGQDTSCFNSLDEADCSIVLDEPVATDKVSRPAAADNFFCSGHWEVSATVSEEGSPPVDSGTGKGFGPTRSCPAASGEISRPADVPRPAMPEEICPNCVCCNELESVMAQGYGFVTLLWDGIDIYSDLSTSLNLLPPL